MNTRPEDLAIINNRIFPTILGRRLLHDRSATQVAMGYGEVAMFEALLSHLKPKLSIEIGTQTGVTLATIAHHSTRTISIDIDPAVKTALAPRFPNVDFVTGSSHDVLPVLLQQLTATGVTPDFIFVDGDHTPQGVFLDLQHLLKIQPLTPLWILMHDTFNPGCRQGIRSAPWARNQHCHFVELDYILGILHPDPACLRQMWGGFGLALLLPEPRTHDLVVRQTHQMMFEAAFRASVYQARPQPAGTPAR